jgi:hypothetical protein
MKTRMVDTANRSPRWGTQLIACFGRARLIERVDGRAELRGASVDEETQAKEWISLFRHEAVLHVVRA